MALEYLDHVNIRTANLDSMSGLYQNALQMELGDRPPFAVSGAWLYCGSKAVVHLVEVSEQPAVSGVALEHFAFRAKGLQDFLDCLKTHSVAYSVNIVPAVGNKQVNIFDPDGNHIEIQFDAKEEADLSAYEAEPS